MKTKLLKKLRNKVRLRFNRITKEYEVIEFNSHADDGYLIHYISEEYRIACMYYRHIITTLAREKYRKIESKYIYLK